MGYVAAVAWTLTGLELRLATETGAPPTSVRGGRRRGEGSTYVTGHGDVTQSRPAGARCLESTDDTDDPHNYYALSKRLMASPAAACYPRLRNPRKRSRNTKLVTKRL